MFGNPQQLLLVLTITVLMCHMTIALPAAEKVVPPPDESDVIKEDVIRDGGVDSTTLKVIRVNPLDLPSKEDRTGNNMNSELFQIQTLRPGAKRPYVDSKRMRMRRTRPLAADGDDDVTIMKYAPELKPFPKQKQKLKLRMKKQKQLEYLVDPQQTDGAAASNQPNPLMKVEVTPGAYPIYYVVAKTNGRFGKFPIKAFSTPAQFTKYLLKSKAEPIPHSQRFDR